MSFLQIVVGWPTSRMHQTWVLCALFLLAPPVKADFPDSVVVSDSNMASAAGLEILRSGGNAVDAACATALALGVVDPFASGIGGGGFALVYLAKEKRVFALDFRERAPRALPVGGAPWPPRSALSVGVPGEIAGVAELIRRFGRLDFSSCAKPAIRLARGFRATSRLAAMLTDDRTKNPETARALSLALFGNPGPIRTGDRVRRPQLGATLDKLSQRGPSDFYQGEIAQSIAVGARTAGAIITKEDLKAYTAIERAPIEIGFQGKQVFLMPPPSAGGYIAAQTLLLFDGVAGEFTSKGASLRQNPEALHALAEALKHGFATRARWLGDPDFTPIDLGHLLSPSALQALQIAMKPPHSLPHADYGIPGPTALGIPKDAGTSHLSVVDSEGNAVALTTTINLEFGSRIVAGETGILLNNELDDFTQAGRTGDVFAIAGSPRNAPAPGKRPLSSMTPTIVLDGNGVFAVAGAAGGGRIISATLALLVDAISFHTPADQAVAAPRIHHQWDPDVLEYESGLGNGVVNSLKTWGHTLRARGTVGKANLIIRREKSWSAAADPRSGGAALRTPRTPQKAPAVKNRTPRRKGGGKYQEEVRSNR